MPDEVEKLIKKRKIKKQLNTPKANPDGECPGRIKYKSNRNTRRKTATQEKATDHKRTSAANNNKWGEGRNRDTKRGSIFTKCS